MYGLMAISSLFHLRWTNTPKFHPLPATITRHMLSSPSNANIELELLSSSDHPISSRAPLLFLHGGFGSAAVFVPFMTHLSRTAQTFSLSLRGHGASTSLPYMTMVYGTGIADFAADVRLAVDYIGRVTGRAPVLVGHSSGGGLVQYVLARGGLGVKMPALVLLDAVPHVGSWGVYANWTRWDPWFGLRMLGHLGHVRSPLSKRGLVRGVFFEGGGKGLSDDRMRLFEECMAPYESLLWPMQMFGSFRAWLVGRPRWLTVEDVIEGVDLERREESDRICVIVGEKDVLMDVEMCRRTAVELREGIEGGKQIEDFEVDRGDGVVVESGSGVRFVVVKGAGHHVQNDVQWEVAAEELRRFVLQV